MFSWAWKGLLAAEQNIPCQLDFGRKFVKISVGGSHALALSEGGQVKREKRREKEREREESDYVRRVILHAYTCSLIHNIAVS